MGTLALIGLGSNVGDRQAHLDGAIADLTATSGIVVRAVSSYHETAPVGGPEGQGPFLNAAARLDSDLDPFELLRTLRSIEEKSGRVRTVRWGERPLDLDLLIFGCKRLNTPELILPHPRMAVRRFVLAPLAEIAPDIVDTRTGLSIEELLANLDRRPSCVAIDGPPGTLRDEVIAQIVAGLGAFGLRESEIAEGDVDDGSLEDRSLGQHRWARKLDTTQWLVTDFTFTLGTIWFEGLDPAIAPATPMETKRYVIGSLIQWPFRPTFNLVLPGGIIEARMLRSGFTTKKWDVALTPESSTAEEIAREALAACAASRLD